MTSFVSKICQIPDIILQRRNSPQYFIYKSTNIYPIKLLMQKEETPYEEVVPFFYISNYGVNKPIQAMMREDYKEPQKRVDLLEIAKMNRFGKSFVESMAEFDPEEGYADGFAYNSNIRMARQRRKGVPKVVGPKDMYRYAGTKSMDLGWWNEDPKIDSTWKYTKRFPKPTSERTKYFETMRKIHRFFNI